MAADSIPTISLLPRQEGRIRAGHAWVFANEIHGDVAALPAGGVVDVADAKGRFIGRGLANPRSLLAIRMFSREREDLDDVSFWVGRLESALALRGAVVPGRTAYRLVHGEADGLPGVVIDRYNDVYVVQVNTLGADLRSELLLDAMTRVLTPRAIVRRSDLRSRELEGVGPDHGVARGEVPPAPVIIDELGTTFAIEVAAGQKTGHFFDQAENRAFAGRICRGRTFLDVFSNTGGFALHALRGGATSAVCVDSSADVARLATRNAAINGASSRFEFRIGEAKEEMAALASAGRRFEAVSVDPPAFAKSRKTAGNALRGYADVNAAAIGLVTVGGFLFSSSCSYHVEEERFLEAILEGARKRGRWLRMLRRGEQAPDHPVLPAHPETRYLKHFAFQVLDRPA
jgi:23S rRNA (cytosine1962-C5)-methyltransferase